MSVRNMRATLETRRGARNKNTDRQLMATHHGETCGLFVADGSFMPASWDALISSLKKFSADFMAKRRQPKLQNR